MFVRFVVERIDERSHCRQGLFQALDELRHASLLSADDAPLAEELWDWFAGQLHRPTQLSRSRRPGAQEVAICWYRSESRSHIRRMWQMADLLGRYGRSVQLLTTRRPGYVVYEDTCQIAAIPFRDTRR